MTTGLATPPWATHHTTNGYYHHEFVRTAGGWKSEHLVEEPVWFVNRPES